MELSLQLDWSGRPVLANECLALAMIHWPDQSIRKENFTLN